MDKSPDYQLPNYFFSEGNAMYEKDVIEQLSILEPTEADTPQPAAQALAQVQARPGTILFGVAVLLSIAAGLCVNFKDKPENGS